MSKRIGNIAVIAPEPAGICELCGKTDELRPYGPRGERICLSCAMKDDKTKAIAERQMKRALFGQDIQ